MITWHFHILIFFAFKCSQVKRDNINLMIESPGVFMSHRQVKWNQEFIQKPQCVGTWIQWRNIDKYFLCYFSQWRKTFTALETCWYQRWSISLSTCRRTHSDVRRWTYLCTVMFRFLTGWSSTSSEAPKRWQNHLNSVSHSALMSSSNKNVVDAHWCSWWWDFWIHRSG